jgi:uncharacterized protein YqfA (UPF0365 family)
MEHQIVFSFNTDSSRANELHCVPSEQQRSRFLDGGHRFSILGVDVADLLICKNSARRLSMFGICT